jgi:hypothetical protein
VKTAVGETNDDKLSAECPMRLDISMEELFGVPIDRVWHVLTDPGILA